MSMENMGRPGGRPAGIDRVYQAERAALSARERRLLLEVELELELQDPRLAARFRWDSERNRWCRRRHRWWPFRP